ncbi:MAG: Ytp1 family protein [Asgard group archaeon]|nr:Ytp1 family protein [Asgard group archaeon]
MKLLNLLLFFSAAIAMADMNMDDNEEMEHMDHQDLEPTTSESTNSTESLEPIPHVMKHAHGVPILQTHLLPEERLYWENYNTTTYFTVESKHRPALYLHIISGLLAVFVIYPISLIFNNLNMGKSYLSTLLVHSSTILFSLLNYSIFINSIPELYPGNAYNTMIIILFVTTILQLIFAFIKNIDPGQPNRSDYFELHASSANTSDEEEEEERDTLVGGGISEKSRFPQLQSRIMKFRTWVSGTIFYKISSIGFNLLNWGHFFYYMILVPTGVATFCIYGQEKAVFNLLAHFIKGGVFFAYGILSLSRYCGGFTNKGWAWNHKFIDRTKSQSTWFSLQNKGLWTMEMIESSLILFYGSTNIFLEHLSNAGAEWSPKDLQHVSIAFIFIGCGLCGVITEMKLQDWRYEQAIADLEKVNGGNGDDTQDVSNIIKASPGFSPNPFPIVTIYWTGYLMSKHQQASSLSTEIHIQWGNMFVMGCAFRFITYLLMLLNSKTPKELTGPSRPITELIVSFSLMCGGLIFMELTDPVVLSFEYYGLTSMFTLNLSLGVTTLLMGWQMLLFAFKDWLKNKYAKQDIV